MSVEEKATPQDLLDAMADLAMLKYFPRDSVDSVMSMLVRMIPHRRALKWLVREYVDHIGAWHGPAELRGVLCTRFDAADGIDQICTVPGYTPSDGEARYLAQQYEPMRTLQEPASSPLRQLLGESCASTSPALNLRGRGQHEALPL